MWQGTNVSSTTTDSYWKRAIFIPYLDNLVSQLSTRFSSVNKVAIKGFGLIPSNLSQLSNSSINEFTTFFQEDLPCVQSIEQEILMWKMRWQSIDKKPDTIQRTLEEMNEHLYPNIATILRILLLIPVTSASVERSNSSLKFIKTPLRATMGEERLNALMLLFVHKDIHIDINKIIDLFANRHPRRMLLINPLGD